MIKKARQVQPARLHQRPQPQVPSPRACRSQGPATSEPGWCNNRNHFTVTAHIMICGINAIHAGWKKHVDLIMDFKHTCVGASGKKGAAAAISTSSSSSINKSLSSSSISSSSYTYKERWSALMEECVAFALPVYHGLSRIDTAVRTITSPKGVAMASLISSA